MKENRKTSFKGAEKGNISEVWEIRKLLEVTEQIFSGGTPDTRKPEYWGGSIPWLSSGETRQKFIRNTEKKITQAGVDNSSTRLARKGDVVVAAAGQGYTRGQVSFCLIDTYINQSIVALRADIKKIAPLFLFYNLSSRYKELRQISDAHSSRGSLTTKLLADLNIPVPALEEQEEISKILSSLDFKIDLNHQMNKTFEEIGKAIFKHWFIDFEFPDEEGKPYKSSGGEMVYNEELRKEIPKEWKIEELPQVANVVDCLHIKKPSSEPSGNVLLQVYNFGRNENSIDLTDKYTISDQDYQQWTENIEVAEGDILLTNAGLVGAVARIPPNFKGAIGRNITAVRPTNVSQIYLFRYLLSEYGRREIERNTDTGTIFNVLNVKGIRKIRVLVPPEKVLTEFDHLALPLRWAVENNLDQNVSCSQIRDLLLPRLMSGKIRVPVEASIK